MKKILFIPFMVSVVNVDASVGFNTDGFVITTVTGNTSSEEFNAMTIDSNGNIVAVGQANGNPAYGIICRYTPAGFLDTTFGSGGYVVTDLDGAKDQLWLSVALDANDNIVVAGNITTGVSTMAALLARYTSTGSLDTTFDQHGTVPGCIISGTDDATPADQWNWICIDANNRIVAAGQTSTGHGILARYTSTGSLDTTFDQHGSIPGCIISSVDDATNVLPWQGLVIDNKGNSIVVGLTSSGGPGMYGILARYTPTGVLDTTFNPHGTQGYVISSSIGAGIYNCVAIDEESNIVVAGLRAGGATFSIIARYTSLGALDLTFNASGTPGYSVSTSTTGNVNGYYALAFDLYGNIVVAGGTDSNPYAYGVIVRYTSAGTLDTTFNGTGFVTSTAHDTQSQFWGGLALDATAKIVVAGQTNTINGKTYGVVARYLVNGEFDTPANWNSTVFAQQNAAIPLPVGMLG